MKVLWLCNTILPAVARRMNRETSPVGGWMFSLADDLLTVPGMRLTVCFPIRSGGAQSGTAANGLDYLAFPMRNPNPSYEDSAYRDVFLDLLNKVRPDVVHIWGTEFSYANAMVRCCHKLGIEQRAMISIQGLCSVYANHFYADLPLPVILRFTLRDLIKMDNIVLQRKRFVRRGKLEIQAIRGVGNIVGRTSWDYACALKINPDAQYHKCNETLRDGFYGPQWALDACEQYSIFVSQSVFPLKGLHHTLEALVEIRKKYPAKLYIAGEDIVRMNNPKQHIRQSSYAKYLMEIITMNHLEEAVFFTGLLNENQMCEKMLRSNVFVMSSAIENSPNSLGEAMILGVPTVASFVGGVPDMFIHDQDGLAYSHDAPYMLAHHICRLFKDAGLAEQFSKNARRHALATHDRKNNFNRMLEIYSIIGGRET